MQVKEIRFNPNTDKHDLEFKAKHLRHFLLEGHKIKISVIFRGRMITHAEFGEKLMSEVISKLDDVGKLESSPKMEGKQLIVYMTPDKNKIKALKEKQRSESTQQNL
ncbi:MAG: translation initiation factor IF-3 [Chlorobi bacterium OLB4]|jgi:Translation initiation factor 3 (IF-3)|nr:MAG: translation initiation factor IF-3 [Chlorobi bacterium OLB4]MBV6398176.1 Translation initiation factor IF-3 [Ignavibacteria bacterium]